MKLILVPFMVRRRLSCALLENELLYLDREVVVMPYFLQALLKYPVKDVLLLDLLGKAGDFTASHDLSEFSSCYRLKIVLCLSQRWCMLKTT